MKADLNSAYNLHPQSQKSKGLKDLAQVPGSPSLPGSKDFPRGNRVGPDYKLELSSKIPAPELSAPSIPSPPKLPDLPKTDAVVKDMAKEEIKTKALEKVKEVAPGSVQKPTIIFIKGLDVFSSPSKSERGYAGVGKMAESIEGARIYGWDQKSEIVKEVLKTHKDYPVVLVGHSFGGDTAIEVANELDSLKHQFRKIDLLVTMDAVGFGNEVIPQNVKSHLNVFGENDLLLNDGPHVARRSEKTSVNNILSPLDHTEIDDDREIQFEIVEAINKALNKT